MAEYQRNLTQTALNTPTLRTPTRPPGFISDFLVPLVISLTFGILVSTLVTILRFTYGNPEVKPMLLWFIYFLVVVILTYSVTNVAVWKLLWVALEHFTGRDLDKSGAVGDRPILFGNRNRTVPASQGLIGTVLPRDEEEDDDSGEEETDEVPLKDRISEYAFLPDETTLQWFVRVSSLPEVGTIARQWEPILGRNRYQQFRTALIDGGWARWNVLDDKGEPAYKQGWSYTADSKEICANIKK